MQSQLFKQLTLSTLLSASLLHANETHLKEEILSSERIELFELDAKQANEDSTKLKKDWINPITYKYSKNYGESYDTEKSFISIDQPIFKTGGIYLAIQYATASRKYAHLNIDLQRKALIKDATTMLFNIHKLDYSIEKQILLVKNGEIDIERKKEQVMNGFADTSALDNAILDTNVRKNALADLKFQRVELINNFNNISSGEYQSFNLPKLSMVNQEQFILANLNIARTKADIESKSNFSGMTVAKYLPTVGATFDYTKYHTTNNPSITTEDAQNYGIYISMPLDTRTFNDVQK